MNQMPGEDLEDIISYEITYRKEFIPVVFREVTEIISCNYIHSLGEYIPVNCKTVKKLVPIGYAEIKVPVITPKHKD